MKNIKKILSLLLAVAMIVGIGCYATTQVKAAENPQYMAKIDDAQNNQVRKSISCEANTTYTFTCNYYFKSEGTPYMRFGFVASSAMGGGQSVPGTGEFDAKLVSTANSVGKVTVKYQTPETLPLDNWLNIYFVVTGSAEAEYYIWNVKVCKGDSTTNIVNNATFTQSATEETGGTWIGWAMSGYSSYTYINNVDKSEAAKTSSRNTIVKYDLETYDFLPDYTAVPDYEWDSDEKTLKFTETEIFDLSQISDEYLYKAGYAFIGWKDQNNEWLSNDKMNGYEFAAGTELTAQYVAYNQHANSDFAICTEEMRTDGTLGIRFIVEMSNALVNDILPNADEYGTVVLPSDILAATPWTMHMWQTNDWYDQTFTSSGWADLKYDGKYGANKEVSPEIVKAKNTYETLDDRIYYTLCITNLTEEKDNYDRQYTVKGYVKYTDMNGVERFLYTDYASTNAYLTSQADLAKTDVSEDAQNVLQPIVATVDSSYEADRDIWDSGKTHMTTDNDALLANKSANEEVYKLTVDSKTIYMREVKFNFNLGLSNPLEIIHLSDLHYNYINAQDIAEANSTVLQTYDVRQARWSDSIQGKFTGIGRAMLKYARTADQLVITGDVMDYLTHGATQLLNCEVWDKYPNAMMALGNHEVSQKVSTTVPEKLSSAEIDQWLASVWKHDSTYSKKVLAEKVILVQLDNSRNVFTEEQYNKLSTEIANAKAAGHKILLFMHEPLVTGDETDTNVMPVLNRGDKKTGYNFAEGTADSNVYPTKETNTGRVYNLIVNNADVIKGVFDGHIHTNFYTEIVAKNSDGTAATIPQYTVGGGYSGDMIKIIVE